MLPIRYARLKRSEISRYYLFECICNCVIWGFSDLSLFVFMLYNYTLFGLCIRLYISLQTLRVLQMYAVSSEGTTLLDGEYICLIYIGQPRSVKYGLTWMVPLITNKIYLQTIHSSNITQLPLYYRMAVSIML